MACSTNQPFLSSSSTEERRVNIDTQNKWSEALSNRYNSTRSQENTTPYYPLSTAKRYAMLASQEANGPYVNNDTPYNQVTMHNAKPHHNRTTVRRNYAKSKRNVTRNCQLPPSNQKKKEFRRNTLKESDNEEESANFIKVLVNQEIIVKSGDKKVSVPVKWNKIDSSYKVASDLVLEGVIKPKYDID
jgi:hypothetical protein